MRTQIIYHSPADEKSNKILNLYTGCGHGCKYCYVPHMLKKNRTSFQLSTMPRGNIISRLSQDLRLRSKVAEKILLSHTSDPYQPIEAEHKLTRQAIKVLKEHGASVVILTKAGVLAERDLDLLDPGDEVGVTLTFINRMDSLEWEPAAALPSERVGYLRKAKSLGLKTWVNLEPVIDPKQALALIKEVHSFVDEFCIGRLRYYSLPSPVNWEAFVEEATGLFKEYNRPYYIKQQASEKPAWTGRKAF